MQATVRRFKTKYMYWQHWTQALFTLLFVKEDKTNNTENNFYSIFTIDTVHEAHDYLILTNILNFIISSTISCKGAV